MLLKKQTSTYLNIFAILWIILSSNTLVYCILNMKLCMAVLGGIAAVYLYKCPYITKKNGYIFISIASIVAINLIINVKYSSINENTIILAIRLFSLAVIMSNVSEKDFMFYYVKILLIFSIVSIVCFIFTMVLPGEDLPLQRTITHNGKYYIYTFYYTIGRWKAFGRNSGIFWEPGGYQIYLNFALLILLTKLQFFLQRWKKRNCIIAIAIIVATVLTTMSTTGFICLAVVLLIGILHGDSDSNTKRMLLIVVALALISFISVEGKLGIIESKAINQEGSFSTRYNDTVVSLSLGMSRVFGYGYANTYTTSILESNDVMNNSSGLGGFIVCFGVPLAFVYLGYVYYRLKNMFSLRSIESFLVLILFLLFIMSENIYQITLFLSFLFVWNDTSIEVIEL